MKQKPLILVTNDDGIDSPGLAAAVRAALRVGDVVIAAPNEQQTAMGRAYPDRDDLGVIDTIMIDVGLKDTIEAYAVHGSPGYTARQRSVECQASVPSGADQGNRDHQDSDDREDDDGPEKSGILCECSAGCGVGGDLRCEDACDNNHGNGDCDHGGNNLGHACCHFLHLLFFTSLCIG